MKSGYLFETSRAIPALVRIPDDRGAGSRGGGGGGIVMVLRRWWVEVSGISRVRRRSSEDNSDCVNVAVVGGA